MLEGTVHQGIGLLLFGNSVEEQRTAQIVTAELSFRRSVELLSCLYRHRFPDQHKDELTALCTRLFEAEALRNRITHSTWGAGGEPGYTTRMKITAKQKGFSFQVEKMSREDITAIADGIAVIATEVLTFIIKFIFSWDLGDTEAGPLHH